MQAESSSTALLRDKAKQLFTYLKELSALRTSQVRDVNSYEKVFFWSNVPTEKGCHCIAWEVCDKDGYPDNDHKADVWLEIHKPKLKPHPEPPAEIAEWLDPAEMGNSSLESPGLLNEITRTILSPEGGQNSIQKQFN